MNTERDNWKNVTQDDATADELWLVHRIHGTKPNWMSSENWRANMRVCAQDIREHVRKICDSTKHKNPIHDIMRECRRGQPTIVCLCGSTRFIDAFQRANLEETLAGRIVLSVGCNTKSDADLMAAGKLTIELKEHLDELHKRKIDLADEVLVLNVGGYIGESTRREIMYATACGKPIRLSEPNILPECKAALDALLPPNGEISDRRDNATLKAPKP